MKLSLRQLNTLLYDPKRFYLEEHFSLRPPYLEDPLKEKLLLARYEKQALVHKLYFEPLVLPSTLAPSVRIALEEELEAEHFAIQAQLTHLSLKKEDLFRIEVLDRVAAPIEKNRTKFFPQKTFHGQLPVVSGKGILLPEEKSKKAFIQALSNLLLLHSIEEKFPLTVHFYQEKGLECTPDEVTQLAKQLAQLPPLLEKAPILTSFAGASDKYFVYEPLLPPLTSELSPLLIELEEQLKELYARI